MKATTYKGIQLPQLPASLSREAPDELEDGGEIYATLLNGLDCSGRRLSRLTVEQSHLRQATFLQATLAGLHILDGRIERSDFSAALCEKARLHRVDLSGCRLLGTNFTESSFEDVRWMECNLEQAGFVLASFKAARFEKCILRGASFEGADLSKVVFADCDLSGADLRQARLAGTDFRTARLDGVKVSPNKLAGAIIAPAQAVQVVGLLGVVVQAEEIE
ncbi:MAG: pentapeptide repeat-containing protein [Chloroflexi bacterium]|jgi:uncharacterized protein YjbI with pentapeptide repeats|nr:pentapeptide repeat-containing protein [Anaerolineaceae bacterium]NMB87593.1 pentapeptide repeat-containing protein [Chloroflexota bacterium]